MIFLIFCNATLLICLSGLHFYWALGGRWGFAQALPTNESGKRVLNPKMIDCLIVGVALFSFAIVHLIVADIVLVKLPVWISHYALWVIGSIFFLRAIGEFKYIGFFKRIKSTPFGRNDSRYYSPLCLLIGINAILIQMM